MLGGVVDDCFNPYFAWSQSESGSRGSDWGADLSVSKGREKSIHSVGLLNDELCELRDCIHLLLGILEDVGVRILGHVSETTGTTRWYG